MPGHHDFARELPIANGRLKVFIERGWISPPILGGQAVLREIDVARALLIVDLADVMGVNDEGVDLVLDLLDQLYSLRSAFGHLVDAIEVRPEGIRVHPTHDAQRL